MLLNHHTSSEMVYHTIIHIIQKEIQLEILNLLYHQIYHTNHQRP